MSATLINEHCPVCRSPRDTLLYDVRRPTAHKELGLAGLVKSCDDCGLQFKSFETPAETLYDADYAGAFLENDEYSGENAFRLFASIIGPVYDEAKLRQEKPTLLDIGSGTGTMLDTARQMGFDATGVELSAQLAEVARAKGHDVITRNIADAPLERTFDVISMMDIIEHLTDPKAVLEQLKPLLKPEGRLVVYTPNHASLIVKIADLFYRIGMRGPIDNIYACNHTCFFTSKTLADVLTRAGYRIRKIRHLKYDTSRPGQDVSRVARLAIDTIETLGGATGHHGFRVIMYADLPGEADEMRAPS